MKNPTVIITAILWLGIAQVGLSQQGVAQPAQPSYNQTLALSKEGLRAKNYEGAAREAQTLVALAASPEETGTGLLILGETFYRRQMYAQAAAQWSKVLKLTELEDADLPLLAHLNLARTYAAQNQFDKAVPEYKAVVDNLQEQAKHIQAKDTADEANDKATDEAASAIFSLALANAYYNTQQFDLSQQQLSLVIESSRDNPAFLSVALTRSGQIGFIQGKYKKSLAEFQQILDIKELNSKEVASGIRAYAQRQILPLNGFIASHLEEGGDNSEVKVYITAPKEFDSKINIFIQTFIDEFVVEYAVLETL